MLKRMTLFEYINIFLLTGIVIITLYPILYIISVSFSDTYSIISNQVSIVPRGFNIEAYKKILSDTKIPRAYMNTIIYTGAGTAINLFMTAISAYPLARSSFFGRKLFTKLIVVTMFFTGGIIPRYIIVQSLGMIDTIWALVIPNAIWSFELLILKSFYESLGESLYDSATIDGASEYRIMFQIIIPLSKAALASIGLFYFMGHWNSFFIPMIYLNDIKKFPLQLILKDMLISDTVLGMNEEFKNTTPEALKNATIFISMIPVLIVYPFAQKYFVKGVMLGSLKG